MTPITAETMRRLKAVYNGRIVDDREWIIVLPGTLRLYVCVGDGEAAITARSMSGTNENYLCTLKTEGELQQLIELLNQG